MNIYDPPVSPIESRVCRLVYEAYVAEREELARYEGWCDDEGPLPAGWTLDELVALFKLRVDDLYKSYMILRAKRYAYQMGAEYEYGE